MKHPRGVTLPPEISAKNKKEHRNVYRNQINYSNLSRSNNNALKEFYKTSNSYYKPEWLEDDAYESVIGGIEDITAGIKKAKEEVGSFGRSLKEFEDVGKSFSELLGAGMDTSGLERAKTLVDDIRRGGRTEAQKQSRSDLKYPAKQFGELQKEIQNRLSKSNFKVDYSSMGLSELIKEYKKNEKELVRLKNNIERTITSTGTDFIGAVKKQYDKEMSNNAKADLGLNPEPAKEAINTLEYKIKDLKQQLATLGEQGLGQGSPEYDKIAYELQKTIAVKKQYDTAMKNRAKADLGEEEARRTGRNIRDAKRELNLFKRALNGTLANSINTAFHFANAFAVNFDWTNLGASLASSLKGFFENWDAKLTGETLSNFAKGILKAMTVAIKKLQKDETFKDIGQKLVDFVCGIDWAGLAWDLSKFVKALAEAATDFPKDFALGIAQGIVDKICGADNVKISEIKWVSDIADLAFKILANANPLMAFTNIIDGAISQFERFRDFGIFVGDELVSVWQTIQNAWSAAKSFFADCISGIEAAVVEFPTWIQGKFTLASATWID